MALKEGAIEHYWVFQGIGYKFNGFDNFLSKNLTEFVTFPIFVFVVSWYIQDNDRSQTSYGGINEPNKKFMSKIIVFMVLNLFVLKKIIGFDLTSPAILFLFSYLGFFYHI